MSWMNKMFDLFALNGSSHDRKSNIGSLIRMCAKGVLQFPPSEPLGMIFKVGVGKKGKNQEDLIGSKMDLLCEHEVSASLSGPTVYPADLLWSCCLVITLDGSGYPHDIFLTWYTIITGL